MTEPQKPILSIPALSDLQAKGALKMATQRIVETVNARRGTEFEVSSKLDRHPVLGNAQADLILDTLPGEGQAGFMIAVGTIKNCKAKIGDLLMDSHGHGFSPLFVLHAHEDGMENYAEMLGMADFVSDMLRQFGLDKDSVGIMFREGSIADKGKFVMKMITECPTEAAWEELRAGSEPGAGEICNPPEDEMNALENMGV